VVAQHAPGPRPKIDPVFLQEGVPFMTFAYATTYASYCKLGAVIHEIIAGVGIGFRGGECEGNRLLTSSNAHAFHLLS
jgi:hypothetical protein